MGLGFTTEDVKKFAYVGGIHCLHIYIIEGKYEDGGSMFSKPSANFYQTTQRYIPGDCYCEYCLSWRCNRLFISMTAPLFSVKSLSLTAAYEK